MIATDEQRDARAKQTAEIFTPHFLVNQMLDKLPKSTWEEGKTFCDPACGNGNMLIHILYRKISVHDHAPLEALQSVYGVDIMRNNIRECRIRLLKIVSIFTNVTEDYLDAVFKNMVWLNKKRYPKGSLRYDFSFRFQHNQRDIDTWMNWIAGSILNSAALPVLCGVSSGGIIDMFADENEE